MLIPFTERRQSRCGLWPVVMLCLAAMATAGRAVADPPVGVDVELILAADVSPSINPVEKAVQRSGYIAAFRHPGVWRAIRSGLHGRIAVLYFEWAGEGYQSVVVPWTIIDGRETARAFADNLAAQPVLPEAGTSISASLAFAETLFAVSGAAGTRRVIDISGDEPNNDGPPVGPVRRRLAALGITINGLPIGSGADTVDYYRRSVIGGPGSFVIPVADESDFSLAIRRKLVLEIASCRDP